MSSKIANQLYEALYTTAQAEIVSAKATLNVYFTTPVGIGEHPQHIEEMNKLLETIAAAEDRQAALVKHFPEYKASE